MFMYIDMKVTGVTIPLNKLLQVHNTQNTFVRFQISYFDMTNHCYTNNLTQLQNHTKTLQRDQVYSYHKKVHQETLPDY